MNDETLVKTVLLRGCVERLPVSEASPFDANAANVVIEKRVGMQSTSRAFVAHAALS